MGIGDLFRPKYRHSDADVRAEAVRSLPDGETEFLAEVARGDADASVRLLAINKLCDPDVLSQVSRSEAQPDVAKRAAERAAGIWLGRILDSQEEVAALGCFEKLVANGYQRALSEVAKKSKHARLRAAAVSRINDAKILGDVVRGAHDVETWSAALSRISKDESVLRAIAMDEQRREVALAALELLHSHDELEAVAVKGKNKAVRARAHKRLAVDLERSGLNAVLEGDDGKRAHAERSQLCRQVEELAGSHDWLHARTVIERAEAHWSSLGDGDDSALAERMKAACARFHERFERYGAQALAEAEAREARGHMPEPAPEPVHVEVRVPEPKPIEKAAAEPAEPTTTEAVASSEEAAPVLSPEERRAANLTEFQAFTQRLLDIAAKVDKIKTADKWLTRADEKLSEIGPLPDGMKKPAMEKFAEARRALFIRAGELREVDEWKRWANVPKQEQLITAVEALMNVEDIRGLAKELKDAQNAWREVGPAPRDKAQELWKKFKDACDRVYERVKEQRAGDAEEQKVNLDRKLALCVKAEELAQSTDWGPVSEQFKGLQAEWKTIGPVPRRQSDKIWKRFRAACDQFFEARRPHVERAIEEFAENLALKQALCEEVEAMIASEHDAEQTMRKLSEFRRRWRDVGQVSRRDFRALADRFNTACDRLAGKREEQRLKQETQKRDAITTLLTALEAVLSGSPPPVSNVEAPVAAATDETPAADAPAADAPAADAPAAETVAAEALPTDVVGLTVKLRAARRELAAQKRLDKEDRVLLDRATELVGRAVETSPERFKGSELDPDTNRKRKEKLLAKVEKLVAQREQTSNVSAGSQDLAAKLKAALADRALGGILSKNDNRAAAETVQEARESWARLGPVPGPDGQSLEERFRVACKRALGKSSSEPNVDENLSQ